MSAIDRLLDVAAEQHGLVTTRDALQAHVDPSALRKLDGKALTRLERGIYRVTAFEESPVTTLHAAYLHASHRYARRRTSPSREAVVAASHESARALHALGAHPDQPTLTVPTRYRQYEPVSWYKVVREDLAPSEICWIEGIPTVSNDRAIAQAGETPPERWGDDWTGAFAHIQSNVREIVGVNPSIAQSRLSHVIAMVGELATAWRRDNDAQMTEAIENASALLHRWQRDDTQQQRLFE